MIGHLAIGVLEVQAIGVERRAERAAGVTGRGRHEHALESGFREEARIGHPIQRHPSTEAQIRQLRFLLQCPGDVHERVLQHALHARRDVGESPALRQSRRRSARTDGRGGPKRSTNFDEYDRVAVVWYSKYSGTIANAPSGVRRITLRT
jgi:hypothetical protein